MFFELVSAFHLLTEKETRVLPPIFDRTSIEITKIAGFPYQYYFLTCFMNTVVRVNCASDDIVTFRAEDYVSDDAELSSFYSVADCYLTPRLVHDNPFSNLCFTLSNNF